MLSVKFLFYTAMPRHRGSYAKMNFFEQHVFYESDGAVPIEIASDSADISDISENMSGMFHNSFVFKR